MTPLTKYPMKLLIKITRNLHRSHLVLIILFIGGTRSRVFSNQVVSENFSEPITKAFSNQQGPYTSSMYYIVYLVAYKLSELEG